MGDWPKKQWEMGDSTWETAVWEMGDGPKKQWDMGDR